MTKLKFEKPGVMRARLIKASRSDISRNILNTDTRITKRIAQPACAGTTLAEHIPDIRNWLSSWKDEAERTDGLSLTTVRKSAGAIKITVPSSISFDSLADYAAWIGIAQEYKSSGNRIARLAGIDERLLGMTSRWQLLADLSEPDFLSFSRLIVWRLENPEERPPVRALAIEAGHQMGRNQ